MDDANRKAEGYNPLCGDKLTVYLKVANGVIEDVSFVRQRLRHLHGLGLADDRSAERQESARRSNTLFSEFHAVVTSPEDVPHEDLGKLEVLAGVRDFPARVKCATLAWHTLHAALKDQRQPISTE